MINGVPHLIEIREHHGISSRDPPLIPTQAFCLLLPLTLINDSETMPVLIIPNTGPSVGSRTRRLHRKPTIIHLQTQQHGRRNSWNTRVALELHNMPISKIDVTEVFLRPCRCTAVSAMPSLSAPFFGNHDERSSTAFFVTNSNADKTHSTEQDIWKVPAAIDATLCLMYRIDRISAVREMITDSIAFSYQNNSSELSHKG